VRANTRGGYSNRHGHSGHGHGGPPRPPSMVIHNSPRPLIASFLPPGIRVGSTAGAIWHKGSSHASAGSKKGRHWCT
jgi:hypothetical protein